VGLRKLVFVGGGKSFAGAKKRRKADRSPFEGVREHGVREACLYLSLGRGDQIIKEGDLAFLIPEGGREASDSSKYLARRGRL